MARITEKRLYAVPAQSFTSDGTNVGELQIADSTLFVVGHIVTLLSDTQQPLRLKVKRILNSTTIFVGDEKQPIHHRADISAYLTADNARIYAEEQNRPSVPEQEVERNTYDEEPVIARRVIQVDQQGNKYTVDNPFPVQLSDGSINIGTVNAELEVQLSHVADNPDAGDVPDSVQVGDGVTIMKVDPSNQSISTNRYEKLLPLLVNANWMKLGDFDAIVPSFVGNLATLEYRQNSVIIGKAFFTFNTDSDWDIVLERYINDADGSLLLDDDDTELFLD